ncbi:unnamed protein product [Amoebophrya sp. A25]|nr:unnamed protein product [Amoebophrya sp. A25]|eukprot:GSA25T00026642001.1
MSSSVAAAPAPAPTAATISAASSSAAQGGSPNGKPRRFIVARKVNEQEFVEFAQKMDMINLDPVFDAAPPNFQHFTVPPRVPPEQPPAATEQNVRIANAVEAEAKAAARRSMKSPFTRWDRKISNLHNLTIGEKINSQRHENALARWEKMKKEWERFRNVASKVTERPKEMLTITGAEEYRERVELMDLIDRATPDFIKSGGYGWYQSLRDYGARLITIGNLFSGLYLYIKLKPNANGQIIRKPWLRELAYFRAKNHTHTWRDNPFLVKRKKRYHAAMEMMNPGKLGIDEMLEIEGINAERLAAINEMEEPEEVDEDLDVREDEEVEESPVGPACEFEPSTLEFHALTGQADTTHVTLKNTGSTVLFWELEELPAIKHFKESVCPSDPSRRFQAHCVKGKIFPGAETQIYVTFLSSTAGSFTSRWRLKTNPSIQTEDYVMHGLSYWRHADIISELQVKLHDNQLEAQCKAQIDDIFDAVEVTPFPELDFEQEEIRQLYFEERNPGLHYIPGYYDRVASLLGELREFARSQGMHNQVLWKDDRGKVFADHEYGDHCHYTEENHATCRGHLPMTKPLEPMPITFGPDFEWDLRVQELKDILRDVEPANPDGPEMILARNMRAELDRLVRFFTKRPLERSPVFGILEEETRKFTSLVVDEWTTARAALPEGADADAVAAASEEFCSGFSLFTERKRPSTTNEAGEAVEGEAYVSDILDCEQTMKTASLMHTGPKTMSEAVAAYRNKMTTESADPAGQVVFYEMDLTSIVHVEKQSGKNDDGEDIEELGVEIPDPQELVTRMENGLNELISANPKAVFLSAHIDSTQVASMAGAEEGAEPPTVVPGSVSFRNSKVVEVIQKALGMNVEVLSLDEIADPEFRAEIRKETEEEEELKVLYLIDNLSSSYKELGVRKVDANVQRFTWAERDNWADRTFSFGFDIYIQDSFGVAVRDDYTTQRYQSWDRPALPIRVIGQFLDAEMQNLFAEVLKLGEGGEESGGASSAAGTAAEDDEAGAGVQLQILGGAVEKGEKMQSCVSEKLSFARNMLEEVSQFVFVGGDLALVLLRYVFNCGPLWFDGGDSAAAAASAETPDDIAAFRTSPDLAFSAFLRERIANVVENRNKVLLLPVDFVVDVTLTAEEEAAVAAAAESENPAPPKKPFRLCVGGTATSEGRKVLVRSSEIVYGPHQGKCLILETQEESVSGVWSSCGRVSLVDCAELDADIAAEKWRLVEMERLAAEAVANAEAEGETAEAAPPAVADAEGGDAAAEEPPEPAFQDTWVSSVPAEILSGTGITFRDIGPASVAQIKRVLFKGKSVIAMDRLATFGNDPKAYDGTRKTSDEEVWDYVDERMQPVPSRRRKSRQRRRSQLSSRLRFSLGKA